MQAFILLVFTLGGTVSGVVYDVLYVMRCIVCGINVGAYTVKDKLFTFVCDVIFALSFAIIYIYACVCFDLYVFRLYTLVGAVVGFYIYLKSLHLCIAFLTKKVYNTIDKSIRRKRVCYERRKTQKNCSGSNR